MEPLYETAHIPFEKAVAVQPGKASLRTIRRPSFRPLREVANDSTIIPDDCAYFSRN
jgi:hypothetical protein